MEPRTVMASLRLKRKISQTDAAKRLGVTRVHYCNLESGLSLPSFPLAMHLAKWLGVPTESLWRLTEVGVEARKCHHRKRTAGV